MISIHVDYRIGAPIQFHIWFQCEYEGHFGWGHRFSSMATIFAPMTFIFFVTGHHLWRPNALRICNRILCLYHQPACAHITMFAQVLKRRHQHLLYEGNETAQKLLAELEQCRTRVVLLKLLMQKWLQNFLRRRRAFQKLVKRFWCFSNKTEWRQRLGGCWRHNWKGW